MTRSGPQFVEVCGLLVRTDEPLGDLPLPLSPAGRPDVRIEWHLPVPERTDAAPLTFTTTIGSNRLDVFSVEGGTLWEYPDETRFWVSGSFDQIRCRYPSSYVVADAATYVLGPILGYVLRQLGVPTLHASTVRVGDRTVAIAGPAGAGKSTLTAALVTRGHQLIAEDVTALRGTAERPEVPRGVPFIKLWPDSAATYGRLPLLTPNWDKHFLAAPTVPGDTPLDAVYFLDVADEVTARALSPRDALVALLDNVYVAYALTPAQRSSDLEMFGTMAGSLEMYRITRTDSFDDLDELCRTVESP